MSLAKVILRAGMIAPGCAGTVLAQSPPDDALLPEILVSGYRASLEEAQSTKRAAEQMVDAVVAADIGKLPDINTAEALQRIPGVQINTDLGEGSTVVIRGLGQVETLLNGRETFTAAGTRTLNYEFIPSELLSGVTVYKSPTAAQIEGGIGGIIDIRTYRPLDFPGQGLKAQAAARANYGDLARKVRPQVSMLLSDRWALGAGEAGALFSASYQERQLREDYISAGAPTCYGAIVNGSCSTGLFGPSGYYNPQYTANRKRTGFDAVLQWRTDSNLDLFAEGHYVRFETPLLAFGTFALPDNTLVRSNTELYPGTGIIESATYLQQPLRTLSINRLQTDADRQAAVGGRWSTGKLTLRADLSYLDTREHLQYHELDMQTLLPTFSVDTASSPPSQTYTGVNLLDIANYNFAGLTESVNFWIGRETALQLDASREVGWGPLARLDVGVRYADLADGLTPIRYFNALASGPAAGSPELVEEYPLGTAFSGARDTTISSYLVVDPSQLRNIGGLISALGLSSFPTVQTQGIYTIAERDTAAYVKLSFAWELPVKLGGNLGVRFLHTRNSVAGTETISGSMPVYLPLQLANSYSNVLPSFNLRASLREDLLLRFAAYASLTRPDFSSLNPGLTLVPGNLTGSQGNPHLLPQTATNYDASLEWYFERAGNLHANAFYKKVRGFPFTAGTSQLIGGARYTISQPINSGSGEVQGIEVGYQQFYSRLPRVWSGLGLQANLTYVNSSAPTAVSGYTAPLPNLSRWSYNIIGLYEQGGWSARIAYFWRSQFLQSIAVAAGIGVMPVESESFGQLAASLNWSPDGHVSIELAGTNLTRARHQTFFGSIQSPQATYIDDRQYLAGVRYRF
jgi:TonB-dependent receptor